MTLFKPALPSGNRDPLEVLAEILRSAHELRRVGYPHLNWVREELDHLVHQMCPFDGRVDQHEDAEHRFVPAKR